MIELTTDECRVLGVLIEKALTTPNQYPLSLNAVVDGASQKNNRDPVVEFTEDLAQAGIEGLRDKGLVVQVDQVGSRVHKYRHSAGEKLPARTGELAILAELLLRGPQTLGELRGRASRMNPLDSIDAVKDMLRALMERPEPLVKQIPPSPGSRAERYLQLLCPELHPVESPVEATGATVLSAAPSLAFRVQRLETDVQVLRDTLRRLAEALGEKDPFADSQG